jgi:hypothetical protein
MGGIAGKDRLDPCAENCTDDPDQKDVLILSRISSHD